MNLISDDLYIYGLYLGIFIQAVIAFFFRKKLSGLFDLFFLNLTYVAFGISGLLLAYFNNLNPRVLEQLILMLLWIFGMYVGVRGIRTSVVIKKSNNDIGFFNGCDVSGFAVVCAIYFLYAFQILSSGIFNIEGFLFESRFVVQQDNKFQAYLFSSASLLPPVLLFRIKPNLKFSSFIFIMAPFWLIQASTLSKTCFLFPVIAASLYYSLQIKCGLVLKPVLKKQFFLLLALMVSVYFIFLFITRFLLGSELSPLSILLNRLFSSFDGLLYLGSLNFKAEGSLSILQWYFSPFLKVLGLFDQPYNAFNYVIAVEYFGQASDYAGMLPNNNHIGELIVTFDPFSRVFVTLLSGLIYGFVYTRSIKYIVAGGVFIIPAAFVVATPFGFLIDGQGWFIAFLSSCILLFFSKIADVFIRLIKLASCSLRVNGFVRSGGDDVNSI